MLTTLVITTLMVLVGVVIFMTILVIVHLVVIAWQYSRYLYRKTTKGEKPLQRRSE